MLAWIRDYLNERKARVRFHGHLSDFMTFENGTPQGEILSLFLFSILIADLLTIHLLPETDLFAYANDLQLIATERNRFTHAQTGLDSLAHRCKELGLKINSAKTGTLQTHLVINGFTSGLTN